MLPSLMFRLCHSRSSVALPSGNAYPPRMSLRNLQTLQHSNSTTRAQANPFGIRIYEKCSCNPIRIRSFKTHDLKPFRMCSFKKSGGEGVLLLTRFLTRKSVLTSLRGRISLHTRRPSDQRKRKTSPKIRSRICIPSNYRAREPAARVRK
jgi:hypothetical protein